MHPSRPTAELSCRSKKKKRKKKGMASMVATGLKRMNPATTAGLVCDIQERFRDVIVGFESLVKCSSFVIKSANELKIPVVVTEQCVRPGSCVAQTRRLASRSPATSSRE